MSSVLRFVRGADLSGTSFAETKFPGDIDQLLNVRWLRLNNASLDSLPSAVNRLSKLEYLSLAKNDLLCIPPSVKLLKHLTTMRAAHNDLCVEDISPDLYRLTELTTLDFSYNKLSEIPDDLSCAGSLIVLSLSHNKIRIISPAVLGYLTELEHLDLSHNQIAVLPPQLRHLRKLQTLVLSGNPLDGDKLKAITGVETLTRLELRATGRSAANVPAELGLLLNLTHLDLSQNSLTMVPVAVMLLSKLRRLNLSDNKIAEVPADIGRLTALRSLLLSRNHLTALPGAALAKLTSLRRLTLNHNRLAALPGALHLLAKLERLEAASNALETVPPLLFGCARLTLLNLQNNKLASLPPEVHGLAALREGGLRVKGNPGLRMPKRPEKAAVPGGEHYFLEFGDKESPASPTSAAARHKGGRGLSRQRLGSARPSLRRSKATTPVVTPRKTSVASDVGTPERLVGADLIMQGMAGGQTSPGSLLREEDEKSRVAAARFQETMADAEQAMRRPMRVIDTLQGPELDCSDTFGDLTNLDDGFIVWRLENFVPTEVEDELEHGKFYDADCYIVLDTKLEETGEKTHTIYFWIGSRSSIDKKASVAMHAVNLRNALKLRGMCHREEQDDESRPFTRLFNHNVTYLEGGTESGFYDIKVERRPTRLFVLSGKRSLRADAVALSPASLRSDFFFLLDVDEENRFYLWRGRAVTGITAQKARLFADKSCKLADEVGRKVVVEHIEEGAEPERFWELLGGPPAEIDEYARKQPLPPRQVTKLHEMRLGEGYLELPQLVAAGKPLTPGMLSTKKVYIVDAYSDIYIWSGQKSSRLVRAAAMRVATELQAILPRPPEASHLTRVVEGNETQTFKSLFKGWDDIVSTDYRARDIIAVERALAAPKAGGAKAAKPGGAAPALAPPINPMSPMAAPSAPGTPAGQQQQSQTQQHDRRALTAGSWEESGGASSTRRPGAPDVDVVDLFSGPDVPGGLSEKDAVRKTTAWADELEKMESFVLRDGKFVRMPEGQIGHFFSEDCYVFLCTQWREVASEEAAEEGEAEEEMECVAYFWQGRDARRMGWLTFQLHTRHQMEELVMQSIGCQLQVQREYQQQETMRFMALFDRQMVVHNGTLAKEQQSSEPRLFCQHAFAPTVFTRTVEVPPEPRQLCSRNNYILRVPFDGASGKGIVYVWRGSLASEEDAYIAQELGRQKLWGAQYSVQVVKEGSEPKNFFWTALGSPADPAASYDRSFGGIGTARFFECSTLSGSYCARELLPDFCQDNLQDNVAAIVDTGGQVYMWVGPYVSDVVQKLTRRCADEYARRCRGARPDVGDVLRIFKGEEPFAFTRAFHGWAKHKLASKDLAKRFDFLGQVVGDDYARTFDEEGTGVCDIVVSEGCGKHHDAPCGSSRGAPAHPLNALPAAAAKSRAPLSKEETVANDLAELGVDGLTAEELSVLEDELVV